MPLNAIKPGAHIRNLATSRSVGEGVTRYAAQSFSVSTQHFTAIYLLSHVIIKVWLIVGLLRKRLWYYPAAILIFGLFIVYQLYRFSFTHSVLPLLITALDLLVIILMWQESNYLRRSFQS